MSGVSVSETKPEAKIDTTMVIANSRKIRPTSPDMKTSGKNTAASETVMERIVKLISRALSRDASSGFIPLSIRRTVFSKNTMASSTRNPMASVSAISDRLSRLYPNWRMAINVSRSDNGSATAGMSVSVALPRNMKITATTSTNANISVACTSATELTIVCERS